MPRSGSRSRSQSQPSSTSRPTRPTTNSRPTTASQTSSSSRTTRPTTNSRPTTTSQPTTNSPQMTNNQPSRTFTTTTIQRSSTRRTAVMNTYGIASTHIGVAFDAGVWYGGYNPYAYGRSAFWNHNRAVRWTRTNECGITDSNVDMLGTILVHFPHDFITLRLPASELVFSGCSHSVFNSHFDTYYGGPVSSTSQSSGGLIASIIVSVIVLIILAIVISFFVVPQFIVIGRTVDEQVTETTTIITETRS